MTWPEEPDWTTWTRVDGWVIVPVEDPGYQFCSRGSEFEPNERYAFCRGGFNVTVVDIQTATYKFYDDIMSAEGYVFVQCGHHSIYAKYQVEMNWAQDTIYFWKDGVPLSCTIETDDKAGAWEDFFYSFILSPSAEWLLVYYCDPQVGPDHFEYRLYHAS